ncbi:hypothetical protein DSO57_1010764 [Entomophthora muscae]|uniref:Uncharacterized protein n=1 Tax=Entomophthora muscae TaxID=34485 RepID=A0ACC2UG86_9FUNG|nr:hypothetical protein DSO57_1010764 [Entomophthora muscae]
MTFPPTKLDVTYGKPHKKEQKANCTLHNVPELRINKTKREISKILVGNVHVYSPALASEEAEFTKILGGKIDAAFYSLSSMVSYKPSTPSSKSVVQDSGMPTSSQLSIITKKKSCNNKSKAATTTPTDKTNEPVPSLTNLLQNLNKDEDFSFNGVYLTDNQISCALKLLELVFAAWSDPQSAVGPVPLWYGSDSHKYQLQQAMGTTLELLSYSCSGSRQSMALLGNLVLSVSKVVYHQRLHHMPKYIEWLLGVIYLVGGKKTEEYAQQESLLWECIFLGLAFPYSIGVNRVNFLPVDDYPFLPFAFRWLPNVWVIYTVIAKVLIQLCLGLEAIVSQ